MGFDGLLELEENAIQKAQLLAKKFAEIQKTQSNKTRLIDAVVNSVVVSDEEVSVLVNIADETKTPPLTEIKSAIQRCSSIVACGGGDGTINEHIRIATYHIAIITRFRKRVKRK